MPLDLESPRPRCETWEHAASVVQKNKRQGWKLLPNRPTKFCREGQKDPRLQERDFTQRKNNIYNFEIYTTGTSILKDHAERATCQNCSTCLTYCPRFRCLPRWQRNANILWYTSLRSDMPFKYTIPMPVSRPLKRTQQADTIHTAPRQHRRFGSTARNVRRLLARACRRLIDRIVCPHTSTLRRNRCWTRNLLERHGRIVRALEPVKAPVASCLESGGEGITRAS